MSKLLFWILMFFLALSGRKEYYASGQLKSITFSSSFWRLLWWLILGMLLWGTGVK